MNNYVTITIIIKIQAFVILYQLVEYSKNENHLNVL